MAKPVWTSGVASARNAGKSFQSLLHVTCIKRCCSLCMALCLDCPAGRMEADEVVAAILGLGGPSYRYLLQILQIYHQIL